METATAAATKTQSRRNCPDRHQETKPGTAQSQKGEKRTRPRDGSKRNANITFKLGGPTPKTPCRAASANSGRDSWAEERDQGDPKQAALYQSRSARVTRAPAPNRASGATRHAQRTRSPRRTTTGAIVYSEIAAKAARKPARVVGHPIPCSSAVTTSSQARYRRAAVQACEKNDLP